MKLAIGLLMFSTGATTAVLAADSATVAATAAGAEVVRLGLSDAV